MIKYRGTTNICISCGGQFPAKIDRQTYSDYIEYVCPDCLNIVLRGIRATNGEHANSPATPPYELTDRVILPEDVDFHTWETWWTDRLGITLVNGVPVGGTEDLKPFVDRIEEIYDDSS